MIPGRAVSLISTYYNEGAPWRAFFVFHYGQAPKARLPKFILTEA